MGRGRTLVCGNANLLTAYISRAVLSTTRRSIGFLNPPSTSSTALKFMTSTLTRSELLCHIYNLFRVKYNSISLSPRQKYRKSDKKSHYLFLISVTCTQNIKFTTAKCMVD